MAWSGVPPRQTEGFLGKIFVLRNVSHPCTTSETSSDWDGKRMKESRHTDRQKSRDGVCYALMENLQHHRSLAY